MSQPLAQEILAIDLLTGEVASVDPRSGAVLPIGSTGLNQFYWTAATVSPSGEILGAYGRYDHAFELHSIDRQTGAASFRAQLSLTGIIGLAVDDSGQLFALNESAPGFPTSTANLYEIDPITGGSTWIGGTGLTGCSSFAFWDGSFWTFSFNLGLLRIDASTLAITDVNPSFTGPAISAELLCFSDAGTLYQLDDGLWVQDVLTGVPAFIGEAPHFGIFGGAAFLPGPAPPFALGTLGQTGGPMGAQTWGATPGRDVVLLAALGPAGVAQIPAGRPCAGTTLDLNATYRAAAVLRADAQGHALAGPVHAPAAVAGSLRLQALDLTTCTTSNLARVIY